MAQRRRPRPAGLDQQLSYYRDFLDWATQGEKVPVIESTWRWLVEHRPAEEGEVVISWGDSRIGNIIWDDFTCAAVVDWEMASLAQPELDLGWWLYFDRQFSEGLGVPRPAGFGSHEDTIERYSELMGRPMRDIFYYEIFSGFRFAVVMYRLSDLVFGREDMEQDDGDGHEQHRHPAAGQDAGARSAHVVPGRPDGPLVVGSVVGDGVVARFGGHTRRPQPVPQPVRAPVALHGLLPAVEDLVQPVHRFDRGDHVDRHLVVVARRCRECSPPKGSSVTCGDGSRST